MHRFTQSSVKRDVRGCNDPSFTEKIDAVALLKGNLMAVTQQDTRIGSLQNFGLLIHAVNVGRDAEGLKVADIGCPKIAHAIGRSIVLVCSRGHTV